MHRSGVYGWLLALLSILLTITLGEAFVRHIDHLPLFAWYLPETPPLAGGSSSRDTADERYVGLVRLANGVDPAWYRRNPPPHAAIPLTPPLERRYERYKSLDLGMAFRVWNRVELHNQICNPATAAAYLPYDDFFVFDPPTDTPYPPYRHLPNVQVPGWFPANRFGWRGSDLTLNKPHNVIRIAFLGSSKTVDPYGEPFSHIELIEEWLNLWMHARGYPFRVEVINAARVGVSERSTAPILLNEVLPLEPDLVIDDGSNDFAPHLLIQTAQDPPPVPGPVLMPGGAWNTDAHFALSRRIHTVVVRLRHLDGSEPKKPARRIRWPANVDEFHPDPTKSPLPMDIHLLFGFYDAIRTGLQAQGGQFALPSWVWMVRDGLKLSLPRDLTLYNYLNSTYYPLTYAQLERARDFYNRAFRAYAEHYGLPFFDLAGASPLDPELFVDAVHMTAQGRRLESWNYLQMLIPWLETQITRGALPRPMQHVRDVHPAFPATAYPLVPRSDIQKTCH